MRTPEENHQHRQNAAAAAGRLWDTAISRGMDSKQLFMGAMAVLANQEPILCGELLQALNAAVSSYQPLKIITPTSDDLTRLQ